MTILQLIIARHITDGMAIDNYLHASFVRRPVQSGVESLTLTSFQPGNPS
jgi:hypothetical protein